MEIAAQDSDRSRSKRHARLTVLGKPSCGESHPQEVQAVLHALVAAQWAIRAHLVEKRRTIGNALKIDDAMVAQLFQPEDYAVSLDKAMLLALDDETRWAIRKGLVESWPMPNYLNAIKYEDLEAELPTAVTVVH